MIMRMVGVSVGRVSREKVGRMRRILLSAIACKAVPYVSTLSRKGNIKKLNIEIEYTS